MSNIIEVMARAANDGTESLELTRGDIVDALRAAEQSGWRLVPVRITPEMYGAARSRIEDGLRERIHMAIQAAPRPWEETE